MKILAVDDDPFIVGILPMVLAASGYRDVKVMDAPLAALSLLKRSSTEFECFLLDVQMPGMDGIELCQGIREIPRYAQTPIIMLTAMSEKSYIIRSLAAGATDYVTKPFDIAEIGNRLRAAEQSMMPPKVVPKKPVVAKPGNLSADNTRLTREEMINLFADELYTRNNMRQSRN